MILLNIGITTAVSIVAGSVFQIRSGPSGVWLPATLVFQANFTYGSSGTNATVYVQTSLDGQTTWCDVAAFQFTTASAIKIQTISSSVAQILTPTTPSDGALTVNTALGGIFGNYWRTKYVTTGTYAGNTKLRVDAIGNGLTAST